MPENHLSEAMLYQAGALKIRVAWTIRMRSSIRFALERAASQFSKQAEFSLPHTEVTLLDTPGHVDFRRRWSAHCRCLDCSAGHQWHGRRAAHTETLWRLLTRAGNPDVSVHQQDGFDGADRNALLQELEIAAGQRLRGLHFDGHKWQRSLPCAMKVCSSSTSETGMVDDSQIAQLVAERKAFPVLLRLGA